MFGTASPDAPRASQCVDSAYRAHTTWAHFNFYSKPFIREKRLWLGLTVPGYSHSPAAVRVRGIDHLHLAVPPISCTRSQHRWGQFQSIPAAAAATTTGRRGPSHAAASFADALPDRSISLTWDHAQSQGGTTRDPVPRRRLISRVPLGASASAQRGKRPRESEAGQERSLGEVTGNKDCNFRRDTSRSSSSSEVLNPHEAGPGSSSRTINTHHRQSRIRASPSQVPAAAGHEPPQEAPLITRERRVLQGDRLAFTRNTNHSYDEQDTWIAEPSSGSSRAVGRSTASTRKRAVVAVNVGNGRKEAITSKITDGCTSAETAGGGSPGSPSSSTTRHRGNLRTSTQWRSQAQDAAAGGRAASEPMTWKTKYVFMDLPSDLPSFAAIVRRGAASWHPLLISAALNNMVKLNDGLARNRSYTGGRGGGGTAVTAMATTTSQRGQCDAEVVRELLDILHSAFLPYIPSIACARYAVNPLWICAKTGYWGAPGSVFVAALLQRLRNNDYALLQDPNGKTHGLLWWTLSEYEQQDHQKQQKQRQYSHAVQGQAHAESEVAPLPPSLSPSTPGVGGGPKVSASIASSSVATAPEANDRVAGGMDLLNVSASVLKRQNKLDTDNFKPQSFCNIVLAAARLKYDTDPEFIECLLEHMVKHPGPFHAQDISNAVYALGELYGTNDDYDDGDSVRERRRNAAATSPADPDPPADTGDVRTTRGAKAALSAVEARAGQLSPAVALHVRSLAVLALQIGLRQFNSQALTNTLYGLARLGFGFESAGGGGGTSTPQDEGPDSLRGGASGGEGIRLAAGPAASHEKGPLIKRSSQPSPLASSWSSSSVAVEVENDGTSTQGPQQQQQQGQQQQHQGLKRWELMLPHERQSMRGLLPSEPSAAVRLFVSHLAEHLREQLQHNARLFNSQDISNATWALAMLDYTEQSYYEVAVQAALRDGFVEGATPQSWAMFLWALGGVSHKPPEELLHALRLSVCQRSGSGSRAPSSSSSWWAGDERAWSGLPWLMAQVALYDRDVMDRVGSVAAATGCRGLQPYWVTRSLWALAVMPEGSLVRHAKLTAALVESVNRLQVDQLGGPELAQLWQAHLEMQAASTAATAAVAAAGRELPRPAGLKPDARHAKVGGGGLRPVSRLRRWTPARNSFPSLRLQAAPLSSNAPEAEAAVLPSLRPDLVAAGRELLWGMRAQILVQSASSFQLGVYRYLRGLMAGKLPPSQGQVSSPTAQQQQQQQEGTQQLRQRRSRSRRFSTPVRGEGSDSDGWAIQPYLTSLPRCNDDHDDTHDPVTVRVNATRSTATAMCSSSASHGPANSSTSSSKCGEAEAAAARASAGGAVARIIGVEQEWFVESLGLCVDVCVWLDDGRQVVVEADGPCHYFINQPRVQRLHTALRDRQLSRVFGSDNVKCVPFWDWVTLSGVAAKKAYLSRLLGLGSWG